MYENQKKSKKIKKAWAFIPKQVKLFYF